MNDGKYQEGEAMQELHVIIRFPVKMNPGNTGHLLQVARNHLSAKGLKIEEENGKLVMY